MNIFVAPEKSMTPNERAEALVAGLFSSLKSLEEFLKAYPVEDFRTLVPDLMTIEDRVMNCVVKANRIARIEEMDAILDLEDQT